jgi:hypothetical protein
MTTQEDWRALCAELHAAFNTYAVDESHHDLLIRARVALAQPEPSNRLRYCDVHGQQPENAWGCPECVREMRQQLAQPEPQGLTVEELMELVSRICGLPADCTYTMDGGRFSIEPGELVAFARAVARRSRPTFDPQVLTDEEIDEWQSHCAYLTRPRACGGAGTGDHYWAFDVDSDHVAGIVRAAHTRWGRSAIKPVPVAERLPGPEDCIRRGDDD